MIGLFAVACGGGGPGTPAPTPGDAPMRDEEPLDSTEDEGGEAVPYALPEVWGHAALADRNPDPDVVEVELTAAPMRVRLAEGLEFDMYAYNGQVPGPLIQAKVGDRVIVHFRNELSEPTTVHWHGLRIPDDMDGSPRVQAPVPPGETFVYDFVVPDAGSFWYHPHVRSNEQVEKGLQGPLVVHDPADPEFDAERYLVLDDILVSRDGLVPFLERHPEIVHGRSGNLLLNNGRAEQLSVQVRQGSVERWRVVNTANARTMQLSVTGAVLQVVGTDGGRLATPYRADRLTVPVGQRYDLEIRYTDTGTVSLNSHVLTQNEQREVVELSIPVFEAEVREDAAPPRSIVWPQMPAIDPGTPSQTVTYRLGARQGGPNGLEWTINGEAHPEAPLFSFAQGERVRMVIVNEAGPEHPFHLHGQFFSLAGRPELGLKDTVLVPGLETVEVDAFLDNPGRWMVHCHILEHAELGMMSEIVVEPKPADEG